MLGAEQAASADLQLNHILEKVQPLMKQLPEGFFERLAPEESFNDSQVPTGLPVSWILNFSEQQTRSSNV